MRTRAEKFSNLSGTDSFLRQCADIPHDLTMKPRGYKLNGTIAYKNSRSGLCVP